MLMRKAHPPDGLHSLKGVLLSLVRQSRKKELIDDIVRQEQTDLRQGRAYNSRLQNYIDKYWDVNRAKDHSDSLMRTLRACQSLVDT